MILMQEANRQAGINIIKTYCKKPVLVASTREMSWMGEVDAHTVEL